MENIKWTDMQYNVMFEPVSNIRDKASDFEKCLESDFPNKFNILPNMPNVPYSAPRMLANNMHGLSLNISAESITLTHSIVCLLYTSPSPRDLSTSRMPSSA